MLVVALRVNVGKIIPTFLAVDTCPIGVSVNCVRCHSFTLSLDYGLVQILTTVDVTVVIQIFAIPTYPCLIAN